MDRIIILIAIIAVGVIGMVAMLAEAKQADEAIDAVTVIEPETAEGIPDGVLEAVLESVLLHPPVYFSHTDTFYEQGMSVEIFADDPDAVIFYTLDSSAPNRNSRVYSIPIILTADETAKATTIKAAALSIDEDGEEVISAVVTKSYILGEDVYERFSPDTYIFVLSGEPDDFFDHHRGIFVEGFMREQYIAAGGQVHNPTVPANFNMRGRESERPLYVEVYDSSGNLLVHQAAGVRVAGGWSRGNDQKTLRLIARREYSRGKFRYPFFDDAFNSDGRLITRFDRLTLRNGGNDRTEAALRDEFVLTLAHEAGFPDTQSSVPAAVFFNGSYYGFAWLKQAYCDGYLEQRYGGIRENYRIIQNNERGDNGDREAGEAHAVEDWKYVYNIASDAVSEGADSDKGFNNDRVFEEFCRLVDIDNLMLYYAIQVYIDNKDWPGNNMRMWRYYADDDEIITNPFNDGRWRFLMFDVEFSYGLYGRTTFKETTLAAVLGMPRTNHMGGSSMILRALLQREDMREKFANTICDLIDGAFAHENAERVLKELSESMDDELLRAVMAQTLPTWMYQSIFEKREQIRSFSKGRAESVKAQIITVFELPEDTLSYSIELIGAEGASARLNTRHVVETQTIRAEYFSPYEVELSVYPYAGYEFENWEINGTIYTEPEIKLNFDMADASGKITVRLNTLKLTEGQPLYINELDTGNGADWITLYNPNNVAISTRAYFLSDDPEDLKKWKFPAINVQPDGFLTIAMSNNDSADTLMKPQTNFSLKAGETLLLSDRYGNVIASVIIPETDNGQILRREKDGTYAIVEAD
ncbi:MAG: CotH kinase family protein [Oscillospiraceae bacterium]|nr:CotH kinase family protein [Oscillospiraceae bacterium]